MTEAVDEVIKRLRKKTGAAARIFDTPDGRVFMDALRLEFDPVDLAGKTVEETYQRLGAREVVKYIEQLIQFEVKHSE